MSNSVNDKLKEQFLEEELIYVFAEYNEYKRLAGDFFEDTGGGMHHESNLELEAASWLQNADREALEFLQGYYRHWLNVRGET